MPNKSKPRPGPSWYLRHKNDPGFLDAKNKRLREYRQSRKDDKEFKEQRAHHEDYSKPLQVTWLCAFCHAKERRKYL